jgi:hypothetical protein
MRSSGVCHPQTPKLGGSGRGRRVIAGDVKGYQYPYLFLYYYSSSLRSTFFGTECLVGAFCWWTYVRTFSFTQHPTVKPSGGRTVVRNRLAFESEIDP